MPDQLSLFVDKAGQPAGFRVEPDFVSAEEERALISRIRELPLTPFQFGAFEGKRRVASFGWRYDYSLQKLQPASPVPDWLSPFAHRVESFFRLSNGAIQQVLCTEYDQGVGIGWHRDKPHFNEIFGLSLASPCKFRFRRKVGDAWQRLTFDIEPFPSTGCRASPATFGNTAFRRWRRGATQSPFEQWQSPRRKLACSIERGASHLKAPAIGDFPP
jgi:alkylated DNA repair dioxygenase AlkB